MRLQCLEQRLAVSKCLKLILKKTRVSYFKGLYESRYNWDRNIRELIVDMWQNKRRCGKVGFYTWERKEKEENIWRRKILLADLKRLKIVRCSCSWYQTIMVFWTFVRSFCPPDRISNCEAINRWCSLTGVGQFDDLLVWCNIPNHVEIVQTKSHWYLRLMDPPSLLATVYIPPWLLDW